MGGAYQGNAQLRSTDRCFLPSCLLISCEKLSSLPKNCVHQSIRKDKITTQTQSCTTLFIHKCECILYVREFKCILTIKKISLSLESWFQHQGAHNSYLLPQFIIVTAQTNHWVHTMIKHTFPTEKLVTVTPINNWWLKALFCNWYASTPTNSQSYNYSFNLFYQDSGL